MDRDVLAVPATSVDVEQLIQHTRNICHYRRRLLHVETIRNLMMIRHYDLVQLEAKIEMPRSQDNDAQLTILRSATI